MPRPASILATRGAICNCSANFRTAPSSTRRMTQRVLGSSIPFTSQLIYYTKAVRSFSMSLCGSRKGKERIFHPSGERSGARIPFFPFRRPKSPGWSPGASGRNGKGSLAAHRGGRRQAILFRKMAGDEEKPGGPPPFPRHPKKKTGSPAKTEGDGASSGAKMRRFRLWMKNLKGKATPRPDFDY